MAVKTMPATGEQVGASIRREAQRPAEAQDETTMEQKRLRQETKDKGDDYPAPGGDFKPTIKDVLKDHVLIANAVLIAASLLIPWPINILVAVAAAGTIVDTWVHKFFR